MPIYEFECSDCGRRFDKLVRTAGDEQKIRVKCPHCESEKTTRALSVFSVNAGAKPPERATGGCACGRTTGCGH